jgi:hypothetical protein
MDQQMMMSEDPLEYNSAYPPSNSCSNDQETLDEDFILVIETK